MGNSIATKKGQTEAKPPAYFLTMGSVRCERCGEEFFIGHHPAFKNGALAEKQAHWLELVLGDDHDRDRKHADRIELPE